MDWVEYRFRRKVVLQFEGGSKIASSNLAKANLIFGLFGGG